MIQLTKVKIAGNPGIFWDTKLFMGPGWACPGINVATMKIIMKKTRNRRQNLT